MGAPCSAPSCTGPPALRNGLIALLGIMIGSGFTASMLLGRPAGLAISLAAHLAYLGLYRHFVLSPIIRRYGGYDRLTSYFIGDARRAQSR